MPSSCAGPAPSPTPLSPLPLHPLAPPHPHVEACVRCAPLAAWAARVPASPHRPRRCRRVTTRRDAPHRHHIPQPEAGAHCGLWCHAHHCSHAQRAPRWTPPFCARASRPAQTTHRDTPRRQEKRALLRTLISTALHLPRLSAIPCAGYRHRRPSLPQLV
ncbi:hypothetical protein C8J57DRAFT_1349442 [Mycena rebaudengoi]|nr:hypothetical protein C8J57DRAFT_1349442 [Mycena rebaudengoi]